MEISYRLFSNFLATIILNCTVMKKTVENGLRSNEKLPRL